MPSPKKVKLNSRFLADRSYLLYAYPRTGKYPLEFFLPMLENIEVTESQSSNLAQIDLIGRAGSLFSYLGAKSRTLSLKFNVTLPNIVEYAYQIGLPPDAGAGDFTDANSKTSYEGNFNLFFDKRVNSRRKIDYYTQALTELRQIAFLQQEIVGAKTSIQIPLDANKEPAQSKFTELIKGLQSTIDSLDIGWFNVPKEKEFVAQGAVNYMILWVNVLRSSVLNNTKNTSLGPPIIYLNHGTMYNNIPCVCNNIQIQVNDRAGYDLLSLTPRQIQVSMNLSEVRTGNFGQFEPFRFVENENIAGWESVETYGTLDPYRGLRDDFEIFVKPVGF